MKNTQCIGAEKVRHWCQGHNEDLNARGPKSRIVVKLLLRKKEGVVGCCCFLLKMVKFFIAKNFSIFLAVDLKQSSKTWQCHFFLNLHNLWFFLMCNISNLMMFEFGPQCHTKGIIISEPYIIQLKTLSRHLRQSTF